MAASTGHDRVVPVLGREDARIGRQDPGEPGTPAPAARRRTAAVAGHEGDEATARGLLADPDAGVRATALGALDRSGALGPDDLRAATADADPRVRARAAELLARTGADLDSVALAPLLADGDPTVIEVAAWAAGERLGRATEEDRPRPEPHLVAVLAGLATGHDDALCREAAVARRHRRSRRSARHPRRHQRQGDGAPAGGHRPRPLRRPRGRRRAGLGRTDRDWQVRQAAEDLADDDELV